MTQIKFAKGLNNRKWLFNPDPTKHTREVIFSAKSYSPKCPNLYFNHLLVEKVKAPKHLGLELYEQNWILENKGKLSC